jgi:glycosyltransferase involved in cell wall biosynthesis
MAWEERRTVRRSSCIITFSTWCKQEIIRRHSVEAAKIIVQPMPSALPAEVVPAKSEFVPKNLDVPLQLLLVGRDYQRKGIPTAIEVAKQLNQNGIPAELTICGLTGEPDGPVRFAGLFRKSVPEEVEKYAGLYRQAHLLIHPATFEAAGIVPAEAAAFGVPTITNDVGGLATSVADGVSGIVLPGHSPAATYIEAITKLLRDPEEYRRLSLGARQRYEQEQNWEVAGKRVIKVLEQVVATNKKS